MQQAHVTKALGAGIAALAAMLALWGALFAVQPAYADELVAGDTAITAQSKEPALTVSGADEVRIDQTINLTVNNSESGQTGTWTWTSSNTKLATVSKVSESGSQATYKVKGVADGIVTIKATFKTDSGKTMTVSQEVKVVGVKKASQVVVNGLVYKRNGVTTVELLKTKGNKDIKKTTINVPKTVSICDKSGYKAKYTVTAIHSAALNSQSKTTKIVVSNTVKTIGAHAFCGNPKMRTLILGTGVTKISPYIVHTTNKALKTITIKSTKLKPSAVKNCLAKNKYLKYVKVPKSKAAYYKKKVFTKKVCGIKVTVKS